MVEESKDNILIQRFTQYYEHLIWYSFKNVGACRLGVKKGQHFTCLVF